MTTTPVFTASGSGLSFAGLLHSEWIKLRSLRSTVWCYGVIVLITICLGFLLASFSAGQPTGSPALTNEAQQAASVQVATLGISFSQLIVAVLGALVMTGEYGTGMIRSTLTAVPKRLFALVAKALVFSLTTFVVGFIAILATAALTAPLLATKGVQIDWADSKVCLAFLGGALYLALIGLLALSLGTIVRNSAGGISAALAIVFVLPIIMQIVAGVTGAAWARDLLALLPSQAGMVFYSYQTISTGSIAGTGAGIVLEPWQGILVVVGWVAVFLTAASGLFARRDA